MSTWLNERWRYSSDEGTDYMSAQHLRKISEQATYLAKMFSDQIDSGAVRLPDWVESKLTAAAENIDDIHDYLKDELRTAADKQRCWEGYEPVPGKKPYSDGSCRKKTNV